jgi:membrane protease subunit HflC
MVTFVVRENQNAVHTRFGKPVRTIQDAGLYWRLPWPIDDVITLDTRLEFYDIRLSETLTRDKRNVIIPVYIAWQVVDPLRFTLKAGGRENARAQLESLVTSARNAALANYDFQQLVSSEPGEVKIPEIESQIQAEVSEAARSALGIAVPQVGIKRIALPEANTAYVFERMRAERAQFAARFRAEGQREADRIRAEADAERIRVLAEAEQYAEETRGRAEADAARIYARAHLRDPQLYQFLRGLETLEKSAGQNSTLILRTDVPPFDMLKQAAQLPGDLPAPEDLPPLEFEEEERQPDDPADDGSTQAQAEQFEETVPVYSVERAPDAVSVEQGETPNYEVEDAGEDHTGTPADMQDDVLPALPEQ